MVLMVMMLAVCCLALYNGVRSNNDSDLLKNSDLENSVECTAAHLQDTYACDMFVFLVILCIQITSIRIVVRILVQKKLHQN